MPRSLPLALLLLALTAAPARADFLGWSYDWTASPTSIPMTAAGNLSLQTIHGTSPAASDNIIAVGIFFSQPPVLTPAAPTIGPTPYTLTLTLTDEASGQSGKATFGGTLSGSSTNLANSFTTPTTRHLLLGDNDYTVTVGPYFKPVLTFPGFVGATVEAAPAAKDAPEPATLALAACALPGLLLAVRRRR
jgi:hypothetical protein